MGLALLLFLSFRVLATQSVTLGWDPSTSTNVVGYKVYYGPATQTYTNSLACGNITNVTVSGLVEGAIYYFAATAVDASGNESGFSNEAVYSVPNQPPTLDALTNITVYQNAGPQTVALTGITSGATNSNQTLTVSAVSSDVTIVSTPTIQYTSPNTTGTLTFALAGGAGTATVTVTVDNGGATSNLTSQSFTVTVLAAPLPNQPPTLNALTNITIYQNAGMQALTLSGITSGSSNEIQTLTVSAVSSNPNVISTPLVGYTSPNTTGTLKFAPVTNATGTASITVTVNDGGASNNLTSQTFTVTVIAPPAPNVAPTLNAITNMTILSGSGGQTVALSGITSGSTNEIQTLQVTAVCNNSALLSTPVVTYTSPSTKGQLSFKPLGNKTGTATITVTVNDGGATNSTISRSFTVSVVNTLSGSTKTVGVATNTPATLTAIASTAGQFAFNVTGAAGSNYVVQASSDLVNWVSVKTNASPFTYQEPMSSGGRRFYRAYQK